MKKIFVAFSISIAFISCNSSSVSSDIYEEENPHELIHDDYLIIENRSTDTIVEGFIRDYYDNGILKLELPVLNGQIQGVAKYYYDDSKLKAEIPYLNNLPHGLAKWYYPEGSRAQISRVIRGEKTGETYIYYKNGNIKQYRFYLDGNRLCYRRHYNVNEELIIENGSGIIQANFEDSVFHIKDTIDVLYVVANPPHTIRSFKKQLSYSNGQNSEEEVPINYVYVKFRIVHGEIGRFNLNVSFTVTDTLVNQTEIYEDVTEFIIVD